MQITKNIKCARAASRYRFWTIFFITLLLLPGLATNPARASEASLDSRLTSYGLTNPTVSTSNSKATIVYEQAIAEFNRLEEMLTQLAEVLVIVTEELPGTTRVVLRQYFDDGQIMEVETEANNGGIYLNEQISTQVFKDRLDFRPLTRGPLIIAGECEPGLGENCINCPECGCYPGENCDPSNPAANARGCVVMRAPEHAHLDGDEYVCDEGYEWSPGLSTCLPVVPCPEHAFKFQGECYCDPGYAWNETETACAKVTNLYYPHVACVGDWQTEICLINPSPTESLHGVLKFSSDTGVTVAADQKITLAPHARYQFTLTANSPGASELGYIVFASLSETMCGYLKFYLDGKYRVAIPATREKVSNDNIYISHIASDTLWWTGVSLLNTTPSSKQITITFDDGKTRSVTLAGNEHRALTISSLFDAQKQPGIHSAEIS
ncbi:hypothetical protein KAI46_04450, partial [bacterium]|nr:hypothetical protein [bacterium]